MTQQTWTLQKIHWPVLGSNRLTRFSPSGICLGFKTRYGAQSFIWLMCLASIKKHFLTQHAKLKERKWHTQACIRWAWFNHQRTRSRRCRILRIAFLPCFCFRFVFLFCTRGQSELCDETITLSASKMSKSSGNHGGWQRKWVPTFLLQKSQTRKAAPKYYRCHSRSAPLKGFTFISSLNLGSIVNQTISSVFWN